MNIRMSALIACLCSGLVAAPALSKVPPTEAARLGKDLTPVGAQAAANKDGSIPAWSGKPPKAPAGLKEMGSKDFRLLDPYAADKPLYTVTASNLAQYKDQLSPGQLALFKLYPDSYKLPVYVSRRDVVYPSWVYENTLKNATTAEAGGKTGDTLSGAIGGFPFPIPKSGIEVIWNHRTRYSGSNGTRYNVQAIADTDGKVFYSKLREDFWQPFYDTGATPASIDNIFTYYFQITLAPPRDAGQVGLVHEILDQSIEPRRIWIYNPGQGRVRRAPEVGYDTPGIGTDGLRTNDQVDSFNGALDRYTWKLLGKREMLVPYNAFRLHQSSVKYAQLMTPKHMNQDYTRYEKHRVWVVDAVQRPGAPEHIFKRRTFYIDEDSWTILMVDIYDKRDQLWRFQENHTGPVYIAPTFLFALSAGEAVYDLQSRRYIVQNLNNEEPESYVQKFDKNYFTTNNMKNISAGTQR